MLRVGATECVNEQMKECMAGWMEGQVVGLPGYSHTISPETALLWHRFLLFVPFIDSLNIY